MHNNLFPLGARRHGELSGGDTAHIPSYRRGGDRGQQALEAFTPSSSGCPRASAASQTLQRNGFNYEVIPWGMCSEILLLQRGSLKMYPLSVSSCLPACLTRSLSSQRFLMRSSGKHETQINESLVRRGLSKVTMP